MTALVELELRFDAATHPAHFGAQDTTKVGNSAQSGTTIKCREQVCACWLRAVAEFEAVVNEALISTAPDCRWVLMDAQRDSVVRVVYTPSPGPLMTHHGTTRQPVPSTKVTYDRDAGTGRIDMGDARLLLFQFHHRTVATLLSRAAGAESLHRLRALHDEQVSVLAEAADSQYLRSEALNGEYLNLLDLDDLLAATEQLIATPERTRYAAVLVPGWHGTVEDLTRTLDAATSA